VVEEEERPAREGAMGLRSVALIGNYAPRRCGIATFTQDLRGAMIAGAPGLRVPVTMVSDDPAGYSCPEEVERVVDQSSQPEHRRSGSWINESGVDAVCLQHEFGVYGGSSGSWVLDMIRDVRVPVVTTCHTVLRNPSREQWEVMRELAAESACVVAMTEKGSDLLTSVYGVPKSKLTVIPHGIPDVCVGEQDRDPLRRELGWDGCQVMLSFGLLSPNKGIEYAIRALPEISRAHPGIRYVVVGATHPNLVREQGEQYRERLRELAGELGVSDCLQFIDRFVSREELVRLIAAADIYTTPYLNEEQITSGTLAYAFGMGKPVVSTPYWHAAELLADNAGKIIPFRDSAALADAVGSLLADDENRKAISRLAFERGRAMTWPRVGLDYLDAIHRLVGDRRPAAA
jgi:glycosyltransferase involved in cell wall biosynthesis